MCASSLSAMTRTKCSCLGSSLANNRTFSNSSRPPVSRSNFASDRTLTSVERAVRGRESSAASALVGFLPLLRVGVGGIGDKGIVGVVGGVDWTVGDSDGTKESVGFVVSISEVFSRVGNSLQGTQCADEQARVE